MSELSASLVQFIQAFIPTYQGAEVLLVMAAHPELSFSAADLVVAMRPVLITVPAAREYMELFTKRGLLRESDGCFTYGPKAPELAAAISELARAYNEQPVTLIGAIYRLADGNIRSFADSFKLRHE